MTDEVDVKEVIYEPAGDVLQIWLVDGPVRETYNRPVNDDGMYRIVRLSDPNETVGWEIVGLQHYASVHGEWRPLANNLKSLPGVSVIWREPSPRSGLQELVPA